MITPMPQIFVVRAEYGTYAKHFVAGGYAGIGRINRIAFHPTNSNTIFACTAGGGLWKTTDGGTSWNPLTDNLSYPVYRLVMSGICVLLALGLYLLISKTRLGMKIRAGAFNREMTESLGINIRLIHGVVFALGVALAAIAGMIASPISSVYPGMGSSVLIMCFVVVVIGGIGSVRGALVAALMVGLVDTFGKVLMPQIAGMAVYMLMAGVLLYKPEGLFKQ